MRPFIRLLTCAGVFGLLTIQLEAQEEISADKLPKKVADAVKARFPGAMFVKITKEMENNEVIYDIEMTVGAKKHEMDCKEDGTIVDIQNEIDVKDLPAAVTAAIKAKYPNCTIKEAGEILVVKDKKETKDHYEVLIETADKKEVEVTASLDGTKLE
jgi:Putative beta-lactamase-inhibitor-like, PepSY-like